MSKGPIIINFMGIDGSGKITQAMLLRDRLVELGYDADYVWSRRVPYISKIPAKIFKKLVLKEKKGTPFETYSATKHKRKAVFKNPVLRYLWILLSLVEYRLLIWKKVTVPYGNRQIIICDRYLADALIDFGMSSGLSPKGVTGLLDGLIARSFPTPHRVYFIEISPELGASRKTDGTTVEYLSDFAPMFGEVARHLGAVVFDGSLPLETVAKMTADDAVEFLKGRI